MVGNHLSIPKPVDMNPNLLSPEVLGQRRGSNNDLQRRTPPPQKKNEKLTFFFGHLKFVFLVVYRQSPSEHTTGGRDDDRLVVKHIRTASGRRRWRKRRRARRRGAVEIAERKNRVRIRKKNSGRYFTKTQFFFPSGFWFHRIIIRLQGTWVQSFE